MKSSGDLRQQIRFCTSDDGVRLAFATIGRGPPLAKAANWLTHIEQDVRNPLWRPLLERLASGRTLIRYDQRGCGLSDREVADISFDRWVGDLEAVIEGAGLKRFALLGISQGTASAITYAVRHPERVSHLQGLDNAAIAVRLAINVKTVRNHVTNIFDKLGVSSRAEAIVQAREAGFGRPE